MGCLSWGRYRGKRGRLYGRWKALHYAARRFFAPLLLSVEDDGPRLKIFFTNDTPQPWQGEVRWWLETLVGEALESGREAVSSAPLVTTPVKELDFSSRLAPETARRSVFVAELWQGAAWLGRVVQPFVPDKHLELGEPHLAPALEQAGEELLITLQAASLARFIALELEEADVIFSDNYFDLPAGRTARLTCPLPAGWTLSQARQALHVRSLKESY